MNDAKTDMPMPAPPGAEHKRLEPFTGKFRAEVKIWMGPGDPMVSTGVMTNTFDLDGRFLRHDYKGDPSPGPFPNFEGRGFWGYNDATKKYEGVWVDNASNVMQVDTGNVDDAGKVWTMEGSLPCPQTGQTMTKRSIITLEDNDHHKMEMFFVRDGQETKGMEIDYERVR
jgi:hypothetical protein